MLICTVQHHPRRGLLKLPAHASDMDAGLTCLSRVSMHKYALLHSIRNHSLPLPHTQPQGHKRTCTQVSALAALTALTCLVVHARGPHVLDDLPSQAHTLTSLTGLRWLAVDTFKPEGNQPDFTHTTSDPQLLKAVVSWAEAMPHLQKLRISNVQLDAAASTAVLCQAPSLVAIGCYSLVIPDRPVQHAMGASKLRHVEVSAATSPPLPKAMARFK